MHIISSLAITELLSRLEWALARQASKHALPVAASSCYFPEPTSPACLLLGLGGCRHAKSPCYGLIGYLRESLCLSLYTSLLASRLVPFHLASICHRREHAGALVQICMQCSVK